MTEPNEIPEFNLGCPHFGVLVMWDSLSESPERLWTVAQKLVALGGVYFCCWGSGCEVLHDTIDHAAKENEIAENSVLMTTWHDNESLQEVLWFFINTAFPHDAFEHTTKSMIAISVGNSEWAKECLQALRDPSAFTDRVLKNGESAA